MAWGKLILHKSVSHLRASAKLPGLFLSLIECDSTEGPHPFHLGILQILDVGGKEKRLLENFDVYLHRAKVRRISNDG